MASSSRQQGKGLRTKEELTYEALREMILSGDVPAGEFLSQRGLALRIGCAVVTLRAALRQLENEGLIENVPHWGVRVPVETEESLIDRYYVREVFEVEAVRQIVRNRDQLRPDGLRTLARTCDRLATEPTANPRDFGTVHFDFHQLLVEMSGSPTLARTYSRISLKSVFLWNAVHVWKQNQPQHVGDHDELVRLLWEADEKTAVDTITRHVRRGLRDELAIMELNARAV